MKSISLGSIEQIPIGQGRSFIIEDEVVAVFRTRDGRCLAVANRCPHRGGPLSEGIVGEGKVVCPLHGHKFDLATGQGSEAPECVRTFPVRIEDEQITLDGRNFQKKDSQATSGS